jgi:hypothetical protein
MDSLARHERMFIPCLSECLPRLLALKVPPTGRCSTNLRDSLLGCHKKKEAFFGFIVMASESKFHEPFAPKSIPIVNASPNIDQGWTISDCRQRDVTIGRYFQSVSRVCGAAGPDNHFAEGAIIVPWVPWVLNKSLIARLDFHLAPNGEFISRSLPSVFEFKYSVQRFFLRNQTAPYDCDIGPQLAPSCTHHYAYSSNENEKLQQRDSAGNNSNFVTNSPSIAPVFWSLLLVSCGFWLCVLGGCLPDGLHYGWRSLVGVALFGIGSLLGAAGILPWGFWW